MVPRARYALETLLQPLGVELAPSAESGLGGIWYGERHADAPEGWLHIGYDPQGDAFLTRSFRKTPRRGALVVRQGGITGASGMAGDPIASAFYWLAGLDYRANPERDVHGRVTASGSLLEAWGLLESPPVDQIRTALCQVLVEAGLVPPACLTPGKGVLCPTFDIDYLRKWRPGIVYREVWQYGVLGRGPGRHLSRFGAAPGQAVKDPYRTAVRKIRESLEAAAGQGTFFWKAGATSAHDVAYSLTGGFAKKELVCQAEGHQVGLHPSYHAYNHPGYLAEECARLRDAAGVSPHAIRSHYLRWEDPATPRQYQAEGFAVDSTLGFPDHTGWRNGTCLPFRIWDHDRNQPLDLWEMPLAIMESSLFNRENLSKEEAIARTRDMLDTTSKYGGALVCLWHNVLWDEPDFAGWGEHFLATLEDAKARGMGIHALEAGRKAVL